MGELIIELLHRYIESMLMGFVDRQCFADIGEFECPEQFRQIGFCDCMRQGIKKPLCEGQLDLFFLLQIDLRLEAVEDRGDAWIDMGGELKVLIFEQMREKYPLTYPDRTCDHFFGTDVCKDLVPDKCPLPDRIESPFFQSKRFETLGAA